MKIIVPGRTVKILIALDLKLLREGLREMIREQDDMSVVGESENGVEAVCMAGELHPDIVLVDTALPNLNGIEVARQIKRNNPEIKVIVLDLHGEGSLVQQVFSAGAMGYVLRGTSFAELAEAIRTVISGQIYLSRAMEDIFLRAYIRQLIDEAVPMAPLLSNREREVLQLLSEGLGNKDIATKLGVSVTTVDSHRKHLMDKLSLHSIAALTKYAIREGITSNI